MAFYFSAVEAMDKRIMAAECGLDRFREMREKYDRLFKAFDEAYKRTQKSELTAKIAALDKERDGYAYVVENALMVMDSNLVDYNRADLAAANAAEQKVNALRDRLRAEHLEALKQGRYGYEVGNAYSSLYAQYEKLADYVINVNEAITV